MKNWSRGAPLQHRDFCNHWRLADWCVGRMLICFKNLPMNYCQENGSPIHASKQAAKTVEFFTSGSSSHATFVAAIKVGSVFRARNTREGAENFTWGGLASRIEDANFLSKEPSLEPAFSERLYATGWSNDGGALLEGLLFPRTDFSVVGTDFLVKVTDFSVVLTDFSVIWLISQWCWLISQ